MPLDTLFLRFGIALAIGFLIGLQREYAYAQHERRLTAGERTFALLSLSGCLGGMFSEMFDTPLPFVFLFVLAAIFAAFGYSAIALQKKRLGITTEIAIILAILIGALCYFGFLALAAAIGITITVILNAKIETDRFVNALTQEDIAGALQLAVISIVILPILPNSTPWPAPFDIFNPFNLWLMVIFISAISFLGYVLNKFLNASQGMGLTGMLGGMISSTAVTLSFSERSNSHPRHAQTFAMPIIISWIVMFPRVFVIIGVLSRPLLRSIWIPLAIAAGALFIYSVVLYRSGLSDDEEDYQIEFQNPFNLWTAIRFGLLYALVLFISHVGQIYFGDTGIYVTSILSGLTNINAISLSMAELHAKGVISTSLATQAIILGFMANTLSKAGLVFFLGNKALRKAILPSSVIIFLIGLGAIILS